MRNILARASKSAPSDDESTVIGTPRTHSIVRVSAHHGTIKVVSVIFNPATRVDEISVGSAIGKGWTRSSSAIVGSNWNLCRGHSPCSILDHVRWTDELAVG
jgi:hypothetical protein